MLASASQPLEDGSQPPPVDIDALYLQAADGEKKRRIYGLGSKSAFHPSSLQSTGNLYESSRVKKMVEYLLAEKQAEMVRKLADIDQTKQLLD